jgi:hypothetical protein
VYIVAVEQLESPRIRTPSTYRPAYQFEAEGRSAVGFFVRVLASSGDALQVRVRVNDAWIELVRIDRPSDNNALRAEATDWQPHVELTDPLASGNGVFWLAGGTTASSYRIAAAIPAEWLSAAIRIELFDHRAPDGAILGAAGFDLARDFYYMAAIGDSAMWGNGLRRSAKFTTLVAEGLEAQLGVKVVSQIYAVSGARILPSDDDGDCVGPCPGEVPKGIPAIRDQVDLIQHPEILDLLLVDGCANDVGIASILSPEFSPADLASMAETFCGAHMTALLERAREVVPTATMVVTGYFPLLSDDSDVSGLEQWVGTLGIPGFDGEDLEATKALVAPNAVAFHHASSHALADAAAEIDIMLPDDGPILFVDAGFSSRNATFGPDPWLWGLTGSVDASIFGLLSVDFDLFPEDSLLDERAAGCGEPGVIHDYIPCVYSSVGHPNPAGARAFADRILARLSDFDFTTAARSGSRAARDTETWRR